MLIFALFFINMLKAVCLSVCVRICKNDDVRDREGMRNVCVCVCARVAMCCANRIWWLRTTSYECAYMHTSFIAKVEYSNRSRGRRSKRNKYSSYLGVTYLFAFNYLRLKAKKKPQQQKASKSSLRVSSVWQKIWILCCCFFLNRVCCWCLCVCVRFVHVCYLCACLLGFQNLLNVTERILIKTMSKTTTTATTPTGSTISRNTRSNNSNTNVCVQMIRNAF